MQVKRVLYITNKNNLKEVLIKTSSDGFYALGLLLPYGLLFSVFIAIPIAVAIYLSFTYFDLVQAPTFAGLYNYVTLLTQDTVFFRNVLPNTIQFALIVGPGGYVISFLMAWMLAQIQPGPRTVLALLLYMPSLAGGVFIGVLWRTIFSGNQSGYINAILLNWNLIQTPIQFLQSPKFLMSIMILVSLWSAMGIGFLAMLAGILNINEELYEAAYIDGLRNRFQEIIYITIPSMKPQMLFGAVMAIVGAFNNGAIGVALSGANPTPQYSGQLITNHIDDYGFLRYEMGYAAAVSVALLCIVWVFSKLAYTFFGERD
ncbi:MAG: sugar ABC transporter permease [Treponema sp.]|jgi:multiple sugar transport system permease protein|nr:sugar ABC transporter permease [Treponema sp.]